MGFVAAALVLAGLWLGWFSWRHWQHPGAALWRPGNPTSEQPVPSDVIVVKEVEGVDERRTAGWLWPRRGTQGSGVGGYPQWGRRLWARRPARPLASGDSGAAAAPDEQSGPGGAQG